MVHPGRAALLILSSWTDSDEAGALVYVRARRRLRWERRSHEWIDGTKCRLILLGMEDGYEEIERETVVEEEETKGV